MKDTSAAPATSLVKALHVLLALEQSPAGRGVTEIARELGLPKSAVHRLLVTFQACGFVQQQPTSSRYVLGPVLARLGLRAADLFTPRRVARPLMETLAREVGETVFLGVLCAEHIFIAEKVEHGQVLRIAPELGTRLPLRQTALGQIWLACCPAAQREALLAALPMPPSVVPAERVQAQYRHELSTIAQQGFAVSLETWLPELCCLAVPVWNRRHELIAALAVAVPRSRMPAPQRHDPFAHGSAAAQYPTLLTPLLRTAEQITATVP
ncbi:MAG: IclR family transcriptional regulator [Candidatus Tectomicrobia bacterium]|uniref:IclR family transcriptional regulator n=1 Tax=Tectimicrobiota bacterium TaxID=2528274 RepID=A0A938B283_UNCTE|nr:IclR family transcriptional regulator [Candidatus Tectomicrobia bacterium]